MKKPKKLATLICAFFVCVFLGLQYQSKAQESGPSATGGNSGVQTSETEVSKVATDIGVFSNAWPLLSPRYFVGKIIKLTPGVPASPLNKAVTGNAADFAISQSLKASENLASSVNNLAVSLADLQRTIRALSKSVDELKDDFKKHAETHSLPQSDLRPSNAPVSPQKSFFSN